MINLKETYDEGKTPEYIKKMALDYLASAITYLENSSWGGKDISFGQWYNANFDALDLLKRRRKYAEWADAPVLPRAPKTPLEKATTTFDVIDMTQYGRSVGTLLVIDGERLEREVLKGSIADENVQKLLPFNTHVVRGKNYYHLRNASAYDVTTNSHVIYDGDTLCKRGESPYGYNFQMQVPTCPGCLAKGKAIIVNHLLSTL